jgi:3-methyladenine DNA glycosylase AlkD
MTPPGAGIDTRVAAVLRWLERRGTRRNREGMRRFGISSPRVFGVSMTTMRPLVKSLGRDHALALALWQSGWLEARVLASFVDDPAQVTRRQMDAWASEFDNWAVCDSACIHLFDRTPHAWLKVRAWSGRKPEFVRRAAFATLAGLAIHDKAAPDAAFLAAFELIDAAADDERTYVKKAVNWSLRQMGKRNRRLQRAALATAERLSARPEASARWIGRDALRELRSAAVERRLTLSR